MFVELYDTFNPVLGALFERRVHAFVSADNDAIYHAILSNIGATERLDLP